MFTLSIWLALANVMKKPMAPHSSTLAWKTPGRRSLEGCSPWGRWGSDMTERLHFHLSLSCIGEGNGNPLQYSCPENPRDGGAQSQTRLKRLSSSSSSLLFVSLIHFKFIFVYGVRECFNFILLHVAIQFAQHYLLKRLFSPLYILASFVID